MLQVNIQQGAGGISAPAAAYAQPPLSFSLPAEQPQQQVRRPVKMQQQTVMTVLERWAVPEIVWHTHFLVPFVGAAVQPGLRSARLLAG